MEDRLTVEMNTIALHMASAHLKAPKKQLIKFPIAILLKRPQLNNYVCNMKPSISELS